MQVLSKISQRRTLQTFSIYKNVGIGCETDLVEFIDFEAAASTKALKIREFIAHFGDISGCHCTAIIQG